MSKNIYKGYNFIYEQMQDQKPAEDTNTVDPVAAVTQLFTYLNNVIVVYNLDNDTSSGFDAATKDLQNANNLDEVRKSMINIVGSVTFPDDNSKRAANDYIANVFNTLMKVPDVNNKFGDIKKKLDEIINSCKQKYAQTEQVKAVEEALLREDHGYLENTGTSKSPGGNDDDTDDDTDDGSDADDADDTPSNKWYVTLANHVMDMATTFNSETTAPLLDPNDAGDAQAKSIISKAAEFLANAKKLQVDRKRKGFLIKGKINTAGGKMKGRDFRISCENLIDEIKRQRDALNAIKQKITKIPPPPPINTPKTGSSGMDKNSGQKQTNINPGNCKFPIAISLHVCDEVKKLQSHLMGIACIKDQLMKHGGADGKYGKFTSTVANAAYSVITKNDKFSSSVLTQEMFNGIMKFDTGVKVAENVKAILSTKIFEVEASKKEETLKFEDFGKVFDKSKKIFEEDQKIISDADLICKKVSDKIKSIGGNGGSTGPTGPAGTAGATGATGPAKPAGPDESIKRFKPMADGTYPINYDESMTHFLVNSAIVGFLPHELFGGRNTVKINIKGGFIDKKFCDVIAVGLVHSLDGFVSRDDILAIMQSLCYIKGGYTIDGNKAISAWSYIKSKYTKEGGDGNLSVKAYDWGTNMVRDIKAFPNFKQRKETPTGTSADEAKTLIEDATKSLDSNENNFGKYLASMDPKKIEEIENPSSELEGGDTKPEIQAAKKNSGEEK